MPLRVMQSVRVHSLPEQAQAFNSGLISAAEVGEYDLVLAMGTKLLEKWESRGFRRDILLSMALAQCGLATDTFAVQQVTNTCTSKRLSLLSPSVRTSCCCLQTDCIPHLLMFLCNTSCHAAVCLNATARAASRLCRAFQIANIAQEAALCLV